MKRIAFGLVLVILVFSACGIRKTDTDINKRKEAETEKTTERTTDKTTEQTKSEKSEEQRNDVTEKETIKTTITEYDENGKPTKQTTTETQKDKVDKSINNKKEVATRSFTRFYSALITRSIVKTVTIKEKSKQTETNNLYLYLFGAFVLLLGGWYLGKKFPNVNFKNVS